MYIPSVDKEMAYLFHENVFIIMEVFTSIESDKKGLPNCLNKLTIL